MDLNDDLSRPFMDAWGSALLDRDAARAWRDLMRWQHDREPTPKNRAHMVVALSNYETADARVHVLENR